MREAEDLADSLLRESIALLVVAEQNYALWQELRLANAVNHEPAATGAVTSDIHRQLAALAQADQGLADLLQDVADRRPGSSPLVPVAYGTAVVRLVTSARRARREHP
ncbi:MAG: hypothetical protein M0030_16690 [Actinomycetota bacterium]|nr:hypothetical protein [Actinomycetota bacterium]